MKKMTTQEIKEFNEGTATWKDKRLMDMTRYELYCAFNELAAHLSHELTKNSK